MFLKFQKKKYILKKKKSQFNMNFNHILHVILIYPKTTLKFKHFIDDSYSSRIILIFCKHKGQGGNVIQ